jgi:hypothetical protein
MARLPNIDQAFVEDGKLSDYLLNHAHPRGRAKARFLERFGFSAARPDELRQAFLDQARDNEVSAEQITDFGTVFEISGALASPDGRNPVVRAVWMLDTGSDAPRLITMVPAIGAGTGRRKR